MMHTVHCLFFITEHHHLSLEVVHLPGKNNVAADVLSRNNYPLFFQVSPGARPDPSPIPSQTLRPLVQDWTLINWKGLFVACTGGAYHLPLRGHTSQGRNAIWTPAGTSPLPVEEHTLSARGISTHRRSPTSNSKILLVSSKTLTDFTRSGRPSMPHLELLFVA